MPKIEKKDTLQFCQKYASELIVNNSLGSKLYAGYWEYLQNCHTHYPLGYARVLCPNIRTFRRETRSMIDFNGSHMIS